VHFCVLCLYCVLCIVLVCQIVLCDAAVYYCPRQISLCGTIKLILSYLIVQCLAATLRLKPDGQCVRKIQLHAFFVGFSNEPHHGEPSPRDVTESGSHSFDFLVFELPIPRCFVGLRGGQRLALGAQTEQEGGQRERAREREREGIAPGANVSRLILRFDRYTQRPVC